MISQRRKMAKYLCIILIVFFSFLSIGKIIVTYLARNVQIKGISMAPTFNDGDIILMSCLSKPDRGDIVVCKEKEVASGCIIKRCIGLPGDTIVIDYDKDTVTVNGQVIDEPYLNNKDMWSYEGVETYTVPEGHYFLMGDNRNVSLDSRNEAIGYIESDEILGTVWFNRTNWSRL